MKLLDKSDISVFIDKIDLDKKRTTLATKTELTGEQDKMVQK